MKLFNFLIIAVILIWHSMSMAAEWKNPDQQQPRGWQDPDQAQARQPARSTSQMSEKPPLNLSGAAGLDTRWFCDMQYVYDDKGSGGVQNVKFFLPVIPPGYNILGGYAQGNYNRPDGCVLGVRPLNKESSVLLRPPVNWERIWTDKNSGANRDGSIWQPQSDRADFVCLGSVAVPGYNKPNLANYVCVHQCLVEEVPITDFIWSDRGTGASQDVSIYKLHNSNGFFAVPSHSQPRRLIDIRRTPICRSVN